MDTRNDIREFLTSRRARITPEQVGLPTYGSRRVPGLRREEVAVLAGVSVPYYTRLERGDMSGVSESLLDALSRALQLDEAERAHLLGLPPAPPRPCPLRPRRRALDAERSVPHPLGVAQRSLPRQRRQALPPPGRRRAQPQLRAARAGSRRRPDDLHVHGGARVEVRG